MHRRFFVVFFSLLACCLLFPRAAYAAYSPTVVWSGYYDDGERFGSVVKAGGTFDAAAISLGYDPARISANDKSKLADPDYGGRFYEYSQTFARVNTPLDFPDWVPGYIVMGSTISSAWDSLTNQFVRLWVSGVSTSLRDGALADLMAVLAGEDLGGGSPGIDTSSNLSLIGNLGAIPTNETYNVRADCYTYTFTNNVLTYGNRYHTYISCSPAQLNSATYYGELPLYASAGFAAQFDRYLRAGYDILFFCHPDGEIHILVALHGNITLDVSQSRASIRMVNGMDCTNNSWKFLHGNDIGSFVYAKAFTSALPAIPSGNGLGSTGNFNFSTGWVALFDSSNAGGSAPSEPDGDWPEPETPAAPTAPELPDPVTPTVIPEPTVTEPTPTWPAIPTPTAPTVTLTHTPSGLDYTQLLTLINDNLNDINSYTVAINSNFNSLRSDLVTEFDSVVQALRNIYQYLQHLDNLLERHCVHLQNKMEDVSVDIQNKMRELVHWLADQIDFDSFADGDDDLSDLLSTINDKLGGGTYEPNPISNEDGYYEWLDDLWDRFLLGDDWESSVSGISSSFGQLKTRFPFSVPWDIVALFRLFVHDPVTPEFDLPLYFSPESSTPVHVDLSAWDDVASIVRPLVYVIFALKLALLSRDLLGGLGADKGGL